jgi:hypothetical protein
MDSSYFSARTLISLTILKEVEFGSSVLLLLFREDVD